MTMDIQTQMQDGWNKGLCPLIDGILYTDGVLTSVKVENGGDGLTISKQGSCLLDSIECFVEIDISSTLDYEGAEIGCGASSMGDEGFFYCSKEGVLLWVAFFQGSNPFVDVKMEKGLAVVTNNWGHNLQFHPSDPSTIEAR